MSSSATPSAQRKSGVNDAWLALRREEILEPSLPIVDPHHHLWDFPAHRYLLPELLADTGSGHNVVQTVFVECTAFYRADGQANLKPVGETEFVNGAAAMCASGIYGATQACAGIVSFADLTQGARVGEVLQAHIGAGGGRFRGIRHAAAWQDKTPEVRNSHSNAPQYLYRDHATFREGFAVLGKLGLTFDAWLYHPQIPDLIALARAFPGQTIVLDHVGGPIGLGWYAGKRAEIFKTWVADIQELARCPNVVVKVGGMGMRVNGWQFHKRSAPPSSQELADAWRPWVETVIAAFGVDRCMFESNFPVDKISGSYATYWNAFKRLAAGMSPDEKTALFSGTAKRVYGI
jgi:L-fuconolactonase